MVYWRLRSNVGNAAAIHVRLIHRGVKHWNQWRKLHNNESIDLSDVDLSELNLAGINFIGVNLSAANFHKTNLKGAYLRFANLSSANLSGANLSGADLNSAILTRASLSRARLHKADLCRADLTDADLNEVYGEQAFLIEAKLERATLVSANFSKVIFTDANLEQATLSQANLSKADLSFANLSNANLTQANLSKVIFIEGRLNDAVLDQANLYCANCQRTTFEGASLQAANLGGGNFCEAIFVRADLSGASLKDAKTDHANFSGAQFDNAQRSDSPTTLNGMELEEVQWLSPSTDFAEGRHLSSSLASQSSAADLESTASAQFLQDSWEQELSRSSSLPLPSLELPSLPSPFSLSHSTPSAHGESTNITLRFRGAIDWIALAIALKRMNQTGALPGLNLVSLETLPGQEILVRLESTAPADANEVENQLMQYYENLCTVLTQSFRQPLGVSELPHRRRVSDSRLGSLTQLFDLLTANFL
jgi:uncharacterized protein YjbI with pentapeptide repeats